MTDPAARLADLTRILDAIAAKAAAMPIKGTAIAAWYDPATGLLSISRDCGRQFSPRENLLAIAGSKIAEMCDTRRDSGSGVRPAATGEFAYHGGVLKASGPGYYLAAFSGASGPDDVLAAQHGLDQIAPHA